MSDEQTCCFNGAKDAGAERWDPRFDCAELAVWHVLFAVGEPGDAVSNGPPTHRARHTFTCEEHVMNVYYTIAMRHRAGPGCDGAGTRWNLRRNECVPSFTR